MKLIQTSSYRTKNADVMELPSNNTEFIVVLREGSKRQFLTPESIYSLPSLLEQLKQSIFIEIYLYDKNKKLKPKDEAVHNYPYCFMDPDKRYEWLGHMFIGKIPDKPYYYVTGTSAKNGYGPMLYDKTIEIVSKLGCKLVSGSAEYYLRGKKREVTSPAAQAVWNKYKDRQDVTKHDIGDDFFALSKDPDQKYFYE